MKIQNKSEIISHILTPAIKFWLRSQLETVEDLTMEIHAGDKQILTGKINQVSLETTKAIYQGIHVSKASVNTENIAVNLGGILRGKPLKLLQPIFVQGEVILSDNDLQTSLESTLLHQGLIDLVSLLLNHQQIPNYEKILAQYNFFWHNITLKDDKFILSAILTNSIEQKFNLTITSNLTLKDDQTLLFNPIEIIGIPDIKNIIIHHFEVDLGNDVALEKLTLTSQNLSCLGKLKVVSE
jgi:hypothetical protein